MIKLLLIPLICFVGFVTILNAQSHHSIITKPAAQTLSSSAINNSSVRGILNSVRQNNVLSTTEQQNQTNVLQLTSNPQQNHTARISAALDVGVSAVSNPQNNDIICQNPFTPAITVKNYGTDIITTVTINTYINGSTTAAYSNIYTGTIAAGTEATVNLVPHTIPTEQLVSLRFEASLPNGQPDANAANNSFMVNSIISYNVLNLPYSQGFENTSALGGIAIYNFDQDTFQWRILNGYSAFGIGSACVYFDNYGMNTTSGWLAPNGTEDWLVMPPVNLSTVTTPSLSFDKAYKGYTENGVNYSDTLLVVVSSDCYTTYNYIYNHYGETLSCQTGAAAFSASGFVPTATDWCTANVDLSLFAGESHVNIIFINLAGESNRLFLDNINIKNNCALTAAVPNRTNVTCLGGNNGQATVSTTNGQSPYHYLWSNGQSVQTATGLSAGNYTVTVTDANNCTATASISITQPQTGIVGQISNVVNAGCQPNSGQFQVTATGGTSPYTFNNGTNSQTTGIFTGLNAGTYVVTISDANACSATITATLQSSSNVSVSMQSTATTCATNDGTATVSATGGSSPYTYVWNSGQTSATLVNLSSGTYVVTVTDLLNCQSVGAVTVTNGCTSCSFDVDIISQNETCLNANNGVITIVPVTGTLPFIYRWSHDTNNVLNSASNLSPGTYFITITDANSCQVIRTVGIGQGSSMTVDISVQNNNSTAMALVQGGVAPYSYLWSDGSTHASLVATPTGSGYFSVTITDANGCVIISPPVHLIPLNVSEIEDLQDFSIFPNPNNGNFTVNVQLLKMQAFDLVLVDVLGRTLNTYHFNESTINMPMDFTSLAEGMYFMVLKTANQVQTKKLTIKR